MPGTTANFEATDSGPFAAREHPYQTLGTAPPPINAHESEIQQSREGREGPSLVKAQSAIVRLGIVSKEGVRSSTLSSTHGSSVGHGRNMEATIQGYTTNHEVRLKREINEINRRWRCSSHEQRQEFCHGGQCDAWGCPNTPEEAKETLKKRASANDP